MSQSIDALQCFCYVLFWSPSFLIVWTLECLQTFFLVDNSVVIIMVDLNFWKFFFKTLKDVSGTTNNYVKFSNAA